MKTWVLLLVTSSFAFAQTPKRVLYVTHSAGFRHSCLELSQQVMSSLSPDIQVTSTEDLSFISAARLRDFDAVFFYTSGDLALSNQQKSDLLAFVRDGKGFGGAHSATDTLYNWPEYGDLIGGYFDGHPWAQEVGIDIEDPDHPATRHLVPSFRFVDEIYQFRAFSRERVRVLMTLDTRTVNLSHPDVRRTDGDFALAWVRPYGTGRVFYTALGHFEETWQNARFQQMIRGALRWLTGLEAGDASPRGFATPSVFPPPRISPGDVIEIYGQNLTSGSTMVANYSNWPLRLAGARVRVNGTDAPILYASPGQINVQIPYGTPLGTAQIAVGTGVAATTVAAASPKIYAVTGTSSTITLWASGLGEVQPAVPTGSLSLLTVLSETIARPVVRLNGTPANVKFSGIAPGWVGLYQVNVDRPAGMSGNVDVVLEIGGAMASLSAELAANER